MIGIAADAKTGQVTLIDDGLPQTPMQPWVEPEGLDLVATKGELALLKERVDALEATPKTASTGQRIISGLAKLVGRG